MYIKQFSSTDVVKELLQSGICSSATSCEHHVTHCANVKQSHVCHMYTEQNKQVNAQIKCKHYSF